MSNSVDICGMQEVTPAQYDYLRSELPNYTFVGVARDDGKRLGEFSNLIFRSDKFELLDSATFWLSETPQIPGKMGWDAACARIATWAILRDLASGEELFVINTHLDHVGKVAKRNGYQMVVTALDSLRGGRPALALGDFNVTVEDEAMTSALSLGIVANSKEKSKVVEGVEWTFHAFGRVPLERRNTIDFILTTEEVEVLKHSTIFVDSVPYISDHNPVMVQIEL